MGIFHFPTIYDYWRTDEITSMALLIIRNITRNRYILLRKFIHCSDPIEEDFRTIRIGRYKQPVWYKKLQLFASEIRSNWKKLRILNSHTAQSELDTSTLLAFG